MPAGRDSWCSCPWRSQRRRDYTARAVSAEPEPAAAAGTAPAAPSEPTRRRPRLNGAGEERPAFLLEFPDDPELELLIAAFESGNFAWVRAEAPNLAARTSSEAVRRAALELRSRTDPDPLLVGMLGLCILLFVFLVVWIYRG